MSRVARLLRVVLATAACAGLAHPPQVGAAPPAPPRATVEPALAAPDGPLVEVKERSFDAGKVDRGVLVTHTFILRNAGKRDLTVGVEPG